MMIIKKTDPDMVKPKGPVERAVSRMGSKGKGVSESMKEINVEATVNNIELISDFVNEQLEAAGCPTKAVFQIDVAIDELFGNIARYAYKGAPGNVLVRFQLIQTPPSAMITLIDEGIPFNPLECEEPDITLPSGERPVGGLGVFLSRKIMDELRYEYKNGKNILHIIKNF